MAKRIYAIAHIDYGEKNDGAQAMKKGHRSHDMRAVEADYATGLYSLRQLAKKYGMSEASVRRAAKEGLWDKDTQQHRDTVNDAMANGLTPEELKAASRDPAAESVSKLLKDSMAKATRPRVMLKPKKASDAQAQSSDAPTPASDAPGQGCDAPGQARGKTSDAQGKKGGKEGEPSDAVDPAPGFSGDASDAASDAVMHSNGPSGTDDDDGLTDDERAELEAVVTAERPFLDLSRATPEQIKQRRLEEAQQDVADMNKGLNVARKALTRAAQMVDRVTAPKDLKSIVEASSGAVTMIRKIRALDDDAPPETNVEVHVDAGMDELRQAFLKRLNESRPAEQSKPV